MIRISITAVPNQRLTVTAGGYRYSIRIGSTASGMFADVTRNGVDLVVGQRIVANSLIIPYRYIAKGSNFAIMTDGSSPDWRRFGVDQNLFHIPD